MVMLRYPCLKVCMLLLIMCFGVLEQFWFYAIHDIPRDWYTTCMTWVSDDVEVDQQMM